ncbi:larval cuticle protein 4-like [Scaptodrosophila lebanonensis]|uniref:Larval cuticle protein 4-like n=1 Tax=Drosophila lebanonensis TaxID=7225 RepID=A0A6J2TMK6_DROLE|nr:larval cuticle protein 4-like [Scaptodrosophila lebanonensis]
MTPLPDTDHHVVLQFVIAILIASCAASEDDAHAHVQKQFKKEDGKGHFEYGFDITNGIGAGEAGDEHQVKGEYHFVSKEGVPVKVSYTADERGYRPNSDLLPTPPPTPEAILKALAYIQAHPRKEEQSPKPQRRH